MGTLASPSGDVRDGQECPSYLPSRPALEQQKADQPHASQDRRVRCRPQRTPKRDGPFLVEAAVLTAEMPEVAHDRDNAEVVMGGSILEKA